MEIATERVPLNINIPAPLRDELRSVVPKRQRSKFVVDAIQSALREQSKQRLLDLIDNLPKHDTNGPDSVELLRQMRQERTDHIVGRHSPSES